MVSGLLAVLALPLMALAFVAALLLTKALPYRLTTEFHPVRKEGRDRLVPPLVLLFSPFS